MTSSFRTTQLWSKDGDIFSMGLKRPSLLCHSWPPPEKSDTILREVSWHMTALRIPDCFDNDGEAPRTSWPGCPLEMSRHSGRVLSGGRVENTDACLSNSKTCISNGKWTRLSTCLNDCVFSYPANWKLMQFKLKLCLLFARFCSVFYVAGFCFKGGATLA